MRTSIEDKVATLDKVLGICNAIGSSYSPGEASLQPAALKALLELAREKQEAVNVTRTEHALAVNARADGFAGLPTLAARIARFVNVAKPQPSDRAEVILIKRRFFSSARNKSRMPLESDGKPTVTRSRSKLDRGTMLETFRQLILVVERIPGYNPNEPEFKVAGLKSKLSELEHLMRAVSLSQIAHQEAMAVRDELVLGPDGVVESSRLAKDYMRAKFGFTSFRTKNFTQSVNNV